ncbi:DUF4349 domain-containing protein [Asaia sp. BMEF1]|uniref:DUF4349 domain-containing protein n=1 Tax=Asaia sp. BMEF1 TaxID=3155932 RepID=UPI003F67EFBD
MMVRQATRYVPIRIAGMATLGLVVVALGGCKHRHAGQAGTEASSDSISQPAMLSMIPRVASFAGSRKTGPGSIAYEHSLSLIVASDKVGAHLEKLRDDCLAQAGCELVSASEDTEGSGPESDRRTARLSARLPHDRVASFLAVAAAPLPGEPAGKVVTQQLRTSQRDLHDEITDVDRRIVQMTAYRDRLEALEGQSAGKTDDLIKVAKELSDAQTELESVAREKQDLSRRVETEEVDVTYESAHENLGPLRRSLRESGALFSDTLADLWDFLIQALVWAPLVVVGLLIVRRAIRRRWFSAK